MKQGLLWLEVCAGRASTVAASRVSSAFNMSIFGV